MSNLFSYPAKNFKNQDVKISINPDPVIVGEDGRFSLHVSSSTGKHQFIVGRLDDSKSPKNAILDQKKMLV